MAELNSFHLCNNVILTAYSWAFDKFEQGINRAHRLNSPWPVNVWSVICDGSIDRKLEAGEDLFQRGNETVPQASRGCDGQQLFWFSMK